MADLPIGYRLKRTHLLFRSSMDARLGSLGCTAAMYEVLFHLQHGGPQSASDVASAAGVTPQTMHRQTRGLLGAGLIRAVDGPGRAIRLELTKKGEALFVRSCAELEVLEDRLVEGLSADDRRALARLLSVCETNLLNIDQRPGDPPDASRGGD